MAESRQCGTCGARRMERAQRDIRRDFQGQTLTIPAVDGWHCPACGEMEFADSEGAAWFFAAVQAAQQHTMQQQAKTLRSIRSRLGLTQKQAAELFGGGVNAFSEYERGITRPSKATVLLLHLLDKHPELLQEAQQIGQR